MTDRPPWIDDPKDLVREKADCCYEPAIAEKAVMVLDTFDASTRGSSPANAAAIAVFAAAKVERRPMTQTRAADIFDASRQSVGQKWREAADAFVEAKQ